MMTDLELTKKVAEKCGFEYPKTMTLFAGEISVMRDDSWKNFDPLNDMNDLMRIVVPRLVELGYILSIWNIPLKGKRFVITHLWLESGSGSYNPADFARACCELLVEADHD